MKSFVPESHGALRAFLDDLDRESRESKESWSEIKRWDRYVELSRGQNIYGSRETPVFQADIVSPTVNRKTALLTESEPILDVMPLRPGLDATAEMLKRQMLATWQAQSVQMMLEAGRAFIGAMGCFGVRVTWNRQASYGLGDIQLPVIDPRTVRFDPAITRAYELDRAQYIGPIESVRPLAELQRRFPEKAERLKPSRITTLTGQQSKRGFWAGLRGALKTPVGISRGGGNRGAGGELGAVPRVYVREYWVADPAADESDAPLYPGGRLFIRVGQSDDDIVVNFDPDPELDRTRNPYFDGLWDVEWLDNTPDLDHPWGRSEVGALRFLQESFNREGNLLVKAGLRNGFPWIFAPNNALSPEKVRELEDLEQMVVQYQYGRDVRRDVPPINPGEQLAMMNMILTLCDFIVGTGDAGMKGQGRVEQRSGEQLEGLQRAGQAIVRAEARRLEAFLARVGKKIISRIFQFYSDDRLMAYYGGGDSFQKFLFERKKLVAEIQTLGAKEALRKAKKDGREAPDIGEVTDAMLTAIKGAWRDFDFKIVPESSLATTKVQRAMLRFQLAQALMIPKRDVLETAGYANPEEKYQEALEEQVKENQLRQSMGLPPPEPPKQKKGGQKKQGVL